MPSLESNRMLAVAADACDSKKAEDIRILALDPSESSLTDYFLICTGNSDRQNVAIADEIEFRLKKEFNTYPNSVEGRRQGEWVLMDYVDFVVHIFTPERREYYGLERLRKSARSIGVGELDEEIKAAVTKARADAPAKKAAAKKAVAKKAAVEKTAAKATAKKAVLKKAAAKRSARGKESASPRTSTGGKKAPSRPAKKAV